MPNIYFPIKINTKKYRKGAIFLKVLKADTFDVIDICTSDITQDIINNSSFDFNNLRYKKEDTIIAEDTKVIAYYDKENDLLGLISYSSHPQLYWFPRKSIENNEDMLNKTLNINIENCLNIDKSFNRHYSLEVSANYRVPVPKCSIKMNMSVEQFDKEVLNKDTSNNKEDEYIEKSTHNNNEENTSLDIIIKDIVQREIALKEKQDKLDIKENALNIKEKELEERENSLLKDIAFMPEFKVAESEILTDNMDDMGKEDTVEKSLYELIIKMLNIKDTISIPFEIYKQFSVKIKGEPIDKNSSYTKYSYIAVLKFERYQVKSTTVFVEIDNENPVKITILSKYGSKELSDIAISKIKDEYREWKRNRSFLV